MIIEHFFTDREQLFAQLGQHCLKAISQSVDSTKSATVYLSGGSTPAPLYEILANSPLNFADVNWAMVDERWVDYDSSGSNHRFIDSCFSSADGFSLLPMTNEATTPALGLNMLERRYSQLPKQSTLCILGMGGDGHTASFFPHAEGLAAALLADNHHRVAAITAVESAVTGRYVERATLTLSNILASDNIILLITGEEKFNVFQQALSSNDIYSTPVTAVLKQHQKDIHVYWSP
ncbi:Glucosamine-6-phosphate deaminase [Sinobacterium norvegicum]|uniref:Glucosamine-6-phosphate deaminase n=1 Tax=Sinobacterium norvegicum TaxID=1641715 RepID=A0ABM9AD87_9GAMM|nr:6-phosphogluconolactonase [Sinobacterium norvegicum]CAH0990914.1 Glucosamine-6-phosphate deaminase [Sinobacterium norvegicum]